MSAPVARRAAVVAGIAVGVVGVAALMTTEARQVRSHVESPVTAMDQRLGPANNSPTMLVDPTNRRFAVMANRLDAPDFSCALQVSGDGGKTWVSADPVPSLPEGAEKCYAPEVAFDRSGLLYYLFVGLQGEGNHPMGVYITTSADHAQTFSRPTVVLGANNFSVRMAIDRSAGGRGRVYLLWLHAASDPPLGGFQDDANPILIAHSDDGGKTFSDPITVSDPERPRAAGPALALGEHHSVNVVYFDLGGDRRDYQGLEGPAWDGTWSLVLATSGDGGEHFGPTSVINDHVVPPERVMLIFTMPPPSVVVANRLFCAAWTDARFGDADALIACSRDGGKRWATPLRLNDDPKDNGHRQYLPRLALGPCGRIDAIFLDRRDDPLNIRNSVMYTHSDDGGRHFARNLRVTHERSTATIGQRYGNISAQGQYEFGSRLGLLPNGRMVIAAWPDTRNSFTATGQDIFVAQIDPPGRFHPRLALGVALSIAGFASAGSVMVASYRRRRRTEPSPETMSTG